MNAERIMYLSDFIASRDDPRLLVLDVRNAGERQAFPLRNRFFSVIYTPRKELLATIVPLATLVGQRHVIVVDTLQVQALAASRLLQSIEVDSAVLEDGVDGWRLALVEESAEVHGEVRIVALSRVACNLRTYLVHAGGEAIVVNPSGSLEAFAAEFRRQRCRPIAIVDTTLPHQRQSCGAELCALTGARYYAPDNVSSPVRLGFAALTVEPNDSLIVEAGDLSIGDRDGATHRVERIPEEGFEIA
jgi:hypothetical protein